MRIQYLVRKAAGVTVAAVFALGITGTATAAPALASAGTAVSASAEAPAANASRRGCPRPDSGPFTKYKFKTLSTKWKATNLKSDWVKGPGTINFQKHKTATVTGTVSSGLLGEKSAIFKSASKVIDIEGSGSWSWGHTWSYELSVPKKKVARMVMFHQMRVIEVRKYQWSVPKCAHVYRTKGKATAPRKAKTANVWRLQYQK